MISSQVDANATLPGWAQKHVEHCPTCRQFHASATAMAQRLVRDKERERCLPPRFLHGKIMSAVRAQESMESRSAFQRLTWQVVASVVCLLLLAGIFWMPRPTKPNESVPRAALGQVELSFNVTLPTAAQMDQWAKTLDEPLETEMQLVINDARVAIHSLKNSFVTETAEGLSHGPN